MNRNRLLKITAAVLLASAGLTQMQAAERIQRYDDVRTVIAPKGSWAVGGSASFSAHENSNYSFVFIDGINSVGFNVSAAPEFCYFIKDNLGIGAKIAYGRTMLDIASANASVGSTSLNIKNYITESQNGSLTAFVRYYIPVGDSRRVSFYVDGGLQGLVGQGMQSDEHTGAVVGTWQKRWKASLVVNPGITAFIGKRTALFASIGIAGISFGNNAQVHNQVTEGSRNSLSASFIMNLAALNIGIDFYLGKR